ncbi:2218_t:CDS:1, partial [Dentiscutata erythropus]
RHYIILTLLRRWLGPSQPDSMTCEMVKTLFTSEGDILRKFEGGVVYFDIAFRTGC